MCTGVIVSTKAVLTTATCVNFLMPEDVDIYAGSTQYYENGLYKSVKRIVMHPAFDKSTYNANLAILGLADPFTPDEMSTYGITVIPLATAPAPQNTYGAVTSYGAIDPSLQLPDNMQKAFLLVHTKATCDKYKPGKITSSMFCAGDMSGKKDLCPGDQGAPFVYGGKLAGIYNWGCSCGLAAPNPSTPVFNNIPLFVTYINLIIAEM